MAMEVVISFFKRFNPKRFWNTFQFWRSVRLAITMTLPILYLYLNPISDDFSRGVFITTLLMSIGDISANYSVRLKLQIVINFLILLMALTMPYVNQNMILFAIYTAVLIFISRQVQKSLPKDNMYMLISMLCLSFMVNDSYKINEHPRFFYAILLAGAWFIGVSLISFLIYKIVKRLGLSIAHSHYEREEYKKVPKTPFFIYSPLSPEEEDKEDDRIFLFRHPFRLFLSIMVGYTLMQQLDSVLDYWIVLTIVLVHNPSKRISASLPKIFERLGGTLVGLLLMLIIVQYNPPKWLELIGIFITSFGIFFTIRKDYFIAVIFITLLVVLNLDFKNSLHSGIYAERMLDTLIGVVIVLGAHSLVLLLEQLFKSRKKGAYKPSQMK